MGGLDIIGKKLVRVEYWFIPPEAHTIASQMRGQAKIVRQQQTRLSKALAKLNSCWEGNAKNSFVSQFSGWPGKVGSYAERIESDAGEVERTKALQYRWEWRDKDQCQGSW